MTFTSVRTARKYLHELAGRLLPVTTCFAFHELDQKEKDEERDRGKDFSSKTRVLRRFARNSWRAIGGREKREETWQRTTAGKVCSPTDL